MKFIPGIALIVSIITYSFWDLMPEGSFFIGNALFIFLILGYIFHLKRKSFVFYLLFCYSINNLLDELFFNPKELNLNELAFAVAVPLMWIIKNKNMPDKVLQSEFYLFFVKIIFPAFVAVGVKLAIEMKKNNSKLSFFNVALSMIIGVGGAYVSSGVVQKLIDIDYVPAVIAIIAIISEKIGEFLIYKLNIDVFLTALVNGFFDFISNSFKRK